MIETLGRRLRDEVDLVGLAGGRPEDIRYLCIPGSVEGGTTTLLGFLGGQRRPAFVVKIQRDASERELVERERMVLDALQARHDELRSSVPRVLFCGPVGGFWVLVESMLEGSPMAATLSAEGLPELAGARRDMALAVDWLIACHRGGAAGREARTGDWAELALAPIAEFLEVFEPSREEQSYLQDLRRAVERRRECWVPLVVRHGDFCRHNILLSGRHGEWRIGVIDWTFSRPVGLPLHDLVFFLATYGLQVRREHGVAGLERMFESTFLQPSAYSRLVADCLVRYCRALGIDRSLVPELFATCLIEQALFEYRQVARAMARGRAPRFAMFLAACEERGYHEAPKAQLWRRFFRRFAHAPSRLLA